MNNMTYSYKPIVPDPELIDPGKPRPKAVVIGAGLGGLSAAMRLGSKGYKVQIIDKLDRLGGEVHLYQKMVTGLILGLQFLLFQKFLKRYGKIVVIL